MRYPPGPPSWLFGLDLLPRIRSDVLGFFGDMGRNYGDIVHIKLGWYHDYFLNHPDLIREVLVLKAKSFTKMAWQRNVLKQWNGNGLLITEGDEWLRQRRLVQRAFNATRFPGYAQQITACTQRFIDVWQSAIDADGVLECDISRAMTDLSLDIISQTMFGTDVTAEVRQLGEAVAILSEVAVREMTSPMTLPDWLPLPRQRRKRWAMSHLDETIWQFIRDRRASPEDRGDLLSMLLLAVDEEGDQKRMTEEEVRNQCMTLFLAGHDTTAAGLTWTWYLLAQHPEVERRMLDEIERVLGEREPTAADCQRLPYTEMVLKESLRLYPPAVGVFAREAIEDVPIGEYVLPKGSIVHILSYVTQRDARWFPEPERFNPERFAPGYEKDLPQFAYFPFGGGPRACIGNHFAMMEMILVLAKIARRYRLSLVEGQDVELLAHMSLRPRGGLRMRIAPRNGQHTNNHFAAGQARPVTI